MFDMKAATNGAIGNTLADDRGGAAPNRAVRMFVIGDSISIHYGPSMGRFLRGRVEVVRLSGFGVPPVDQNVPLGDNWGDSSMVLNTLQNPTLHEAIFQDVVLVNCGLHDIKKDSTKDVWQVPLDRYRRNLLSIVEVFNRSKTEMIWVSSTPVDDDRHNRLMKQFRRFDDDCRSYNAAAEQVMREHGVPVIDLYEFTNKLGGEVYCDHIHFVASIREKQAAYIAGWLAGWITGGRKVLRAQSLQS